MHKPGFIQPDFYSNVPETLILENRKAIYPGTTGLLGLDSLFRGNDTIPDYPRAGSGFK